VKHHNSRALELSINRGPRLRGGALGVSVALVTLLALLIVLVLIGFYLLPGRVSHSGAAHRSVAAQDAAVDFGDGFGDGTPDFLRLTDPADQAAFRRWFTLIAEDAAARPTQEIPTEITDCASLLRYAYREALRKHDEKWFSATGVTAGAPAGEIRKWHYPDTPLGLGLFRVRAGEFVPANLEDGAFAQFADARTLVQRNAFLVSRDVRASLPGDLLFYRQFGRASPWHSMIVTRGGSGGVVVYHTGPDHSPRGRGPVRGDPDHRVPGELRRVSIADLMDHPQAEWRPVAGNPNFLGVFRWNILRGTS
jgi:uncharacterized protein